MSLNKLKLLKMLILTCSLLHCLISFSQDIKPILSKSIINTVESTPSISLGDNLTIQQCIGQSGILGSANANNISIQQGFLNYTNLWSLDHILLKEQLQVNVFPNPFIDYITVELKDNLVDEISINIFDIIGKVIARKKYNANDKIIIPLRGLQIGSYLLHIKSNNSETYKIIIKSI